MEKETHTFQFTWLTTSPLSRGNWIGILLGILPAILALLALIASFGLTGERQGVSLFSAGLFLSQSAVLIQFPTFLGRAELDHEKLTLIGRFSGRRGRRQIPQQAIKEAFFVPLKRPPSWLTVLWGALEVICMLGAISAGWGDGRGLWFWLTAWAMGLSFWPMMIARWQATMQIFLVYEHPGAKGPGLVRAWSTPQHANTLVNMLTEKDPADRPAPLSTTP